MRFAFETVRADKVMGGHEIRPFALWDVCGKKITASKVGNVVFHANDRGDRTGDVGIVHKGCDSDETRFLQWDDLEDFLYHVLYNAGISASALEKRASKLRAAGLS